MHRSVANAVCGRVTKWLVVVFWVAAAAGLGLFASQLPEVENNEISSWLPGDAESTKAIEAQTAFMSPNTIPAVVVYERAGGMTPADMEKAAADAAAFGDLDGTTAGPDDTPVRIDGDVVGPIPSEDGEALQTYVPLDLGADGWQAAPSIVEDIRDTAQADADGMVTHVTGPAGNAADTAKAFEGIDSTLLFATVAVVVVILLLTYRSPVLWLLPVISAGVALVAAQGVIYLAAEYAGVDVNTQSRSILTVLVFGAGTDYALLLVARYREELRRHHDRHEAMAEALHRAGPAIIASAGTVVLGMLCLLAAQMNSTQGLGPVAAIGVAVGVLAMLTLLPALLVIVGRWIFWPVRPQEGTPEPTATGIWARIGTGISHRPRVIWIGTAAALAVLSLGFVGFEVNGLTTAESFRGTPDSIRGDTVVAKHFESDAGNPLVVVTSPDAADDVRDALEGVEGIADIAEPVAQGDQVLVQAGLTDPPISDDAFATVEQARDAVHAADPASLVGGNTALNLDVQDASGRDNLVVIPLVLIVVFLILAVLLRAILAPLLLIATVVLSFGAALGVTALMSRYILDVTSADSSWPLFVFVFLVALGIDYNIFLMTRVREEALLIGTRRGALVGLSATGGVITSAGLVLAGTFAVLASLPLTFLTQMGFAVAFGVLLDTIIVRSVLVTALNLDLGERMWWPSRLSHSSQAPPGGDEHDERAPALSTR
uniref:Putative membrane protein n=1 Tax=uncultured Nocardioidaceae bacterium TaxID=253824 RepID=A0A6J4LH32_9ACTN|nr:MAG: putative membrane protein [uncultured Nocardioidaceae bacterium]